MAWTNLKTDYTDASWSGSRKYNQINNSDGTVSFDDVTQYQNVENSFFGAKDANAMNSAINDIMNGVGDALKALGNIMYPVGSIYMSVNGTDPSVWFGGTWERLKDTFLLGSGDIYTAGQTGGEAKHTLTQDELPEHKHSAVYTNNTSANHSSVSSWGLMWSYGSTENSSHVVTATGSGQAHNNMPPFRTVNMWKRVA